jgi:hypothetical protein
MSTSEDHEGLSGKLERETDALERKSQELGQEISDVRSDWDAKRQDPSVPGALPPPAEHDEDPKGGPENQDHHDQDQDHQDQDQDPDPDPDPDPDQDQDPDQDPDPQDQDR